jgi:hypothetical protein
VRVGYFAELEARVTADEPGLPTRRAYPTSDALGSMWTGDPVLRDGQIRRLIIDRR